MLRWRGKNTVDLDPILAKTVNVITPYPRECFGCDFGPQMICAEFVDSHFPSIETQSVDALSWSTIRHSTILDK